MEHAKLSIKKMNGKGYKDNDYVYTGLCYIKDYEFPGNYFGINKNRINLSHHIN